jgi:protein ImuB
MARSIVLWCPRWPVVAAYRDDSCAEASPEKPLALIQRGVVVECSANAADAGVRPGMKRREAHTLLPELVVIAQNEHRDRAAFDRVLIKLAEYVPQHAVLEPGMVAFGARGLERFYGSEEAASRMLLDALVRTEPLAHGRIGIADDVFTAVTAAQSTSASYPLRRVEPGEQELFLSEMPLDVLGEPDTVSLLQRLGLQTLGDFVELGHVAIRERFGVPGERLFHLATGNSGTPLLVRDTPEDTCERIELPDSCTLVEQVAFGVKARTQQYENRLRAAGVVITRLRIRVGYDDGVEHEKTWNHPRFFQVVDLLDRVRWQLEQAFRDTQGVEREVSPAVLWVEYEALDPEDIASHEPGLWGAGPDSKVHHVLSRVQGLVGASGVLTGSSRKRRLPADTQVMTAWGDQKSQETSGPFPGSLPSPLPATIFSIPRDVSLVGRDGNVVAVSSRAELSSPPEWLISGSRQIRVTSWTGPWPVWEKWWDPSRSRFVHRLQVVDEQGMGWLVSLCEDSWSLEARYD